MSILSSDFREAHGEDVELTVALLWLHDCKDVSKSFRSVRNRQRTSFIVAVGTVDPTLIDRPSLYSLSVTPPTSKEGRWETHTGEGGPPVSAKGHFQRGLYS